MFKGFFSYLPVKGSYLDQVFLIYFHQDIPSAILSVYSSFLMQGYSASSTGGIQWKKRKELYPYYHIHSKPNFLLLNYLNRKESKLKQFTYT